MRTCEKCGAPLPLQKGRHRPRKFCTTCSPPRVRGRGTPTVEGIATVTELVAASPGDSLAASAEARLNAAGKRHDPAGVLVMKLARSIDEGGHSGSSLASLSKEFGRALAVALADVAEDAKVIDDIDWAVQ